MAGQAAFERFRTDFEPLRTGIIRIAASADRGSPYAVLTKCNTPEFLKKFRTCELATA